MPVRNMWRHQEAQNSVAERLLREWVPPAVPCATPMTSFLKTRSGLAHPTLRPDQTNTTQIKTDRYDQRRLCASYTLQLNEFHVLVSRRKVHQGGKMADPGEKTRPHGAFASHPTKNSWSKRDYLKIPKVHAVLLKYGGPENVQPAALYNKTATSQKTNPAGEFSTRNVNNAPSTFYIGMPKCSLKVGNVEAKICHSQQKKKEIFKV